MLFVAYIVIAIAARVMSLFLVQLQGTSRFYTSILGATIVLYCVPTTIFKKRSEKKAEENKKNGKSAQKDTAFRQEIQYE